MTARAPDLVDPPEAQASRTASDAATDRLAIVIITFNEEKNLLPLLESVRSLAARLIVVDSGSCDATCDIARSRGAEVLEHRFESHARQWAWALGQLPAHVEWVLALDADQRLTPQACASVEHLIATVSPGIGGAYLGRRQIFRGKWIRFGGYYPKYLLKLFRRISVRLDQEDLVDHHFAVSGGTVILTGDLIESNANEDQIHVWIEKHNRYATRQAIEELRRRHDPAHRGRLLGSPDERTAWLKSLWRIMPLYWRSLFYFCYRYFIRLGFLDGKQGLIFHFLQGFWYRFLVDVNIDEIEGRRARRQVDDAP